MATKKFFVKTRVDLDNKLYVPGDVVEIDADVAEPLIAANAIEPAADDATPTKGKKK